MARTKIEQHALTRAELLRQGRRIFSTAGYADAATEDIVRQAGLTRGALYYHFRDKRALFEAVVEDVAREMADKIDAAALPAKSAFDGLMLGTHAFLDACLDPATRRIYLVDAPSVLGWHRWREIDGRHGMRTLRIGVEAVLAERPDRALSTEPLAYLLSGALNEAAMWLHEATDESVARREIDRMLLLLFERLFDGRKAR
ncbi:TetR/AcrR family transcriptional regulator [Reyranella sp. CPCC 100927]|uniref:TetR/AcrR family transcriptional regulator n=1 Tax=Reyranella sp. CPCC 100927 TaxID=2599616 RepID=UPI0011B66353|nr:TetR/AcrR family transcriptional regulator [Reyranella sp. CPCC 100927]TWT08858.1 TetR/AcrR family transcriptional regulator [Reyranella sp. CPCC 100927]